METFKISSNQSVVIEPIEIRPSSQSETQLTYNVFFKIPTSVSISEEEQKIIPEQLISQLEYILKLANNGNVNFKCTDVNLSTINYLQLIKTIEITSDVKESIKHMYDNTTAFTRVIAAITTNVFFNGEFNLLSTINDDFAYIGIDVIV